MANENFTSGWTELDAAGVLSETSSTITVTGLSASSPSVHLSKDQGAGFYSGNFLFRFGPIALTSPSSNNSRISLIKVSMGTDSVDDIENQSIVVRWVNTTTNPTLYLSYFATDGLGVETPTAEDSYQGSAVAASTNFYLEIERNGTTVTCKLYSDSGYSTLVDTLSVTVTVHSYRYVHVASKMMTGSGATISGTLQNLDLAYTASSSVKHLRNQLFAFGVGA